MNFINLLKKGKVEWNKWIDENPTKDIALDEEDLSNMDLSGFDLSCITANNTKFEGCNLINVDLSHSELQGAIFSSANLSYAKLHNSNLSDASLDNVIGIGCDFYQAILESADLSNSDFRNSQFGLARLINTKLDSSNITDTKMWETQRVLWSIKSIICDRCYWGELTKHPPSEYSEGEFELLHTYKPTIKLFFEHGIKPLEFFSLSHLLHGIENGFDGCKVRVSSLSEAGKGAEIKLVLEQCKEDDLEIVTQTVNELPKFMRNNEEYISFLEGLNKGLQNSFDKLVLNLMEKSKLQIGNIKGDKIIVSSGDKNTLSIKSSNYTKNEYLIEELDNFLNALRNSSDNTNEVEQLVKSLKSELKKSDKGNKTFIRELANKLNDVLIGASGSGTWEVLTNMLQSLL